MYNKIKLAWTRTWLKEKESQTPYTLKIPGKDLNICIILNLFKMSITNRKIRNYRIDIILPEEENIQKLYN